MKTLEIKDETYESLKSFVVDPFDDVPDTVLLRLIHIANKAKNRWSPFTTSTKAESPGHSMHARTRVPVAREPDKSLLL